MKHLKERDIPTRATMSVASRPFCQNLAMRVTRPCWAVGMSLFARSRLAFLESNLPTGTSQ